MPRRHPNSLALVLVSSLCLAGCRGKVVAPALADAGSSKEPAEEVIGPVYPITDAPADPLTQKLCDALYTHPESRRAECCNAKSGLVVTSECLRSLGSAVRAGAVSLVAAEVDACVGAIKNAYEGCDWVGPFPPATPEPCMGILHGNLGARKRCRSSLECRGSLFCDGVGPTSTGVCGPARPSGAACALAVDPLAAVTRQDRADEEHPECVGHCERHRCAAPISPRGPCASSVQCDATHHCAKQRCMEGRYAKLGEDCTGSACQPDARCVKGKCVTPAKEGAACESDFDCMGACVRKDGGAKGVCGRDCLRR